MKGESAGVAMLATALVAGALYAGAAAQKVTLTGTEFAYAPNRITVKAGQPVQVVLENKGVIEHDFVIDKFKVKMGTVQPGKTGTATFTPNAKGTFEFYCSVPGHKEAGMKGTLVVQ